MKKNMLSSGDTSGSRSLTEGHVKFAHLLKYGLNNYVCKLVNAF